jgi:uncharacterized membrane protein YhaH (DUF805 family)
MIETVYSEQRARIIGVTLRCVQGLALAMVVVALYVLVRLFTDADSSAREAGLLLVIVLLLQAAVLATVVRWTLRRLPDRTADARTWCLTTAGLTLLGSLPLLTNIFGIIAIFLGLFLLTTSLRRDRA